MVEAKFLLFLKKKKNCSKTIN